MRICSLLVLILSLAACGKPSPDTITVGTIAGPETDLVEVAQKVAKEKYGLTVKIVEFNDYNLPNTALNDGSLDANVYQHLPYLEAARQAYGYDLELIGKTFIYPAALYSEKYQTLAELPDKAQIALPNDPSNEARALLLLQSAGLISLKDNGNASIQDIVKNPKKLQFKELDAAQLPRVLADVDAAVINTNFAIPAGLNPAKDALAKETKDSPYANIIVARRNSSKKEQLQKFVKAMHSQKVRKKAQELFGDAAIPAW